MDFWRGPLLVLALLLSVQVLAQEQVVKYYDEAWEEVAKEEATYFSLEELVYSAKPLIKVSSYALENGEKTHVAHYVADAYAAGKEVREGQHIYYKDEKPSWIFNYQDDKLHDSLIMYHDNGKVKRAEVYKEDKLVEGHVYAEDGTELPYFPFEEMPQFPGGEWAMFNYLSMKIQYPRMGLKKKPTGTAKISFTVDKEGFIRDVKVDEGVHPLLDAEAVRVIKSMPEWEPGRQDGKPVPVRYHMPIKFSVR